MSTSDRLVQALGGWATTAAAILSTLLGREVRPSPQESAVLSREELTGQGPAYCYPMTLSAGAVGPLVLVLGREDSARLMDLLVGGDGRSSPEDLAENELNLLGEAVRQVTGSLPAALSRVLGRPVRLNPDPPFLGPLPDQGASRYLRVRFPLELEGAGEIALLLVMPAGLADKLCRAIGEHPGGGAHPPSFENLEPATAPPGDPRLDLIMDVPLQVTVVLGRTTLMIQDLVALSEGSVLELDRLAGEPVELLVHDRLVAYGEVVVVDEQFGVRVLRLAGEKSSPGAVA